MIRRLSLILLLILPFCIKAQQMTGSWEVFTVYNAVDKVLETPSKLYYLSSGNLYSYDMGTQESESLNTQNGLNDSDISNMYYNPADKYLLLTYTNGNIDIIYDNGDIVNMSDIKDAIMATEKTINHVSFYKDRICVATNFGVVLFDGKKHHVIQSGIYKANVDFFAQVGEYFVIKKSDSNLYYLPVNQKFNVIDNFKPLYQSSGSQTYFYYKTGVVVSDNKLIAVNTGGADKMRAYTFDFANGKCAISQVNTTSFNVKDINAWNGGYYITDGTNVLTVDANGENGVLTVLPSLVKGQKIAFWSGVDKVWACDNSGLGYYNLSSGTPTVINDKFKPGNLTVGYIDFLRADAWGNIYMTSRSESLLVSYPKGRETQTDVNRINADGTIENITSSNHTYQNSVFSAAKYQGKLYGNNSICPHPTEQGVYYVGNRAEGIMKFKDNNYLYSYNGNNSNINEIWGWDVNGIDFDSKGNLWGITGTGVTPMIVMLPAAKVAQETTAKDDWIGVNNEFGATHDGYILACKKSNVIIAFDGQGENAPIYFYTTKGTETLTDDKFTEISYFTDQDGRQFSSYKIICALECSDGKVWIGTDDGVFELPNPEKVAEGGTVVRIKVPRNDGTNLADYLLASQLVMCIAEDSSGRKWIATRDSGVYLVSSDGTEIIEHFTQDNSVLNSNDVHSVICSPVSNAVYFGGAGILYKYNATAAPAAEDYSNVIAYPNPVRPDFSGWITIKGLMDSSLVKITDAAGNLVYQTKSEGGMAVWNGCNTSGERVRTGVYYVFASQSAEDQSGNSAVTKILVVK